VVAAIPQAIGHTREVQSIAMMLKATMVTIVAAPEDRVMRTVIT
jgi:hypothetical protein